MSQPQTEDGLKTQINNLRSAKTKYDEIKSNKGDAPEGLPKAPVIIPPRILVAVDGRIKGKQIFGDILDQGVNYHFMLDPKTKQPVITVTEIPVKSAKKPNAPSANIS